MTGLDDMAHMDINSTKHDEEKARQLISMAKRRRSSAASTPVAPFVKPKKKHHGVPTVELDKAANSAREFKFSSLRDVILFTLQAADNCPKYIKIKHRASLARVVLVVIPGLDVVSTFGIQDITTPLQPLTSTPPTLPFFQHNFRQMLLLSAPGDRDSIYPLLRTLAIRPFTKAEKIRITHQLKEKKVELLDLTLSYNEFITNDYPVHPGIEGVAQLEDLEEGWVDTVPFEHDGPFTFALDCEMCESASGKVLARVSLIDFDENVILDEYVKPKEEITDYLTKYSGITEELLSGVTNTLEDVQKKILKTISSKDFLIGHSLENDLKVMKIRHPNIIDTALIFEHPRGPPFKSSLKYLTKQHLGRVIQEGEHDSVEDAKACLDLVKLKISEGGLLGKVIDGQPIFDDLSKIEKSAVFIDQARVQPNQERYIQCTNDDHIVDTVIEKSREKHLVIANLKADPTDLPTLNSRLSKIHRNVPGSTHLIIASGNGDQTEMRRLASQKRSSPETWTTQDEEQLREVTKATRLGVCFFKVVL